MIEPYVDRSIALVEKAIAEAALKDEDIDCILMAGGASKPPLVEEKITARFGGQRVLKRKQPKYCMVEGAAVVAKVYQSVMCSFCGHANDLDATACSVCGTVLNPLICPHCGEGNEPGGDVCTACGESLSGVTVGGLLDPGNIADRHYGIQHRGDDFAIFIHKHDPVPTPMGRRVSRQFPTSLPDQRIFCLLVYGGEDTERASNNTKQGELFAVLPPGLPQGTDVEVSLWLNSDGVFEFLAVLADGTELKPWMLKGEADSAAVRRMESCQSKTRAVWDSLSEAEKTALVHLMDVIFEHLKSGEFQAALQLAEDLELYVTPLS
jgi:molecular chaperone DnaK (HSP70)